MQARAATATASPEELKKSCAKGQAAGCLGLGLLYEQGHPEVAKDESQAAKWYDQACKGGQPAGCDSLGDLYDEGRGVGKDEHRAFELFEQACAAGNLRGCNNLGILYQEGRGVRKDERLAAASYEKSCEGGYANACSNLGALYANGLEGAKNESRAASLFEKACRGNDIRGCSKLYALYVEDEVPQDEMIRRLGGIAGEPPAGAAAFRLIFTLGTDLGIGSAEVTSPNGVRTGTFALLISMGGVLEPLDSTTHVLQLQATAGYKYGRASSYDDGLHTTSTWPVELLAFYKYQAGNLRIGGGLQYQLGASTEGALTWVAQADYLVGDGLSMHLRYTAIDDTSIGGKTHISGGGFGIGFSFYLGYPLSSFSRPARGNP